jgi:hypothetical protein
MAAWVLFPSMGSCLAVSGSGGYSCFLSFAHFPVGGSGTGTPVGGLAAQLASGGRSGAAPAGYLLFLAVPVAAAVLGGAYAAGRSRASSRVEAAGVGAGAGVAFGALSFGLILVSTIAGEAGSTGGTFGIGPQVVASTLLAFAWGIVGGAIGGLARGPEPAGAGGLSDAATGPGASPPT